jgi:hypothetical protein
MGRDDSQQEALRRYLLGELPPEEQYAFEQRLLTDEALFSDLLAEEDELIDDYVGGNLAGAQKEHFEAHFLTDPERRTRLSFARRLLARAAQGAEESGKARKATRRPALFGAFWPPRPAAAGAWLALALLAAVLTAGWYGVRRWGRDDVAAPGRRPEVVAPIFAATLSPGLSRGGGETSRLSVPADATTVQLRLTLEGGGYARYRASLRSEGAELLSDDALAPESAGGDSYVTLNLPAALMPPGDYQVALAGQGADGRYEPAGSYPFRVVRP